MKTTVPLDRITRVRGWQAALVGVIWLGHGAVASAADGIKAIPARTFLDSIGANSAISVRGENLPKTIECARYLGIRWFRSGIEGDIPLRDFVELHKRAGVRFSWGLGSGGTDIAKLIETGRNVAAAGALLAFEGPNEPNNWGITYQGQAGGRERPGYRSRSSRATSTRRSSAIPS